MNTDDKRMQSKSLPRLCICKGPRVTIRVDVKCLDPIGQAELHKDYEACASCATCLSTGGMDKAIKKVLKELIERNRR